MQEINLAAKTTDAETSAVGAMSLLAYPRIPVIAASNLAAKKSTTANRVIGAMSTFAVRRFFDHPCGAPVPLPDYQHKEGNTMRKKLGSYLVALSLSCSAAPAFAGIPTMDIGSILQGILNYIENAAQTVQEYTNYATQLQQYENQIRNTMGAYTSIYSDAKNAVARLETFDNFFDGFHDMAYYKSAGTSLTRFNTIMQSAVSTNSATKKKVDDVAARAIQNVQDTLADDASSINEIERASSASGGQVEAQQFGNQLAAQNAAQTLKLRQELAAYQNAQMAHYAAEADQDAITKAATEQTLKHQFVRSSGKEY